MTHKELDKRLERAAQKLADYVMPKQDSKTMAYNITITREDDELEYTNKAVTDYPPQT